MRRCLRWHHHRVKAMLLILAQSRVVLLNLDVRRRHQKLRLASLAHGIANDYLPTALRARTILWLLKLHVLRLLTHKPRRGSHKTRGLESSWWKHLLRHLPLLGTAHVMLTHVYRSSYLHTQHSSRYGTHKGETPVIEMHLKSIRN